MGIDQGLIGGVINALPIERMIGGPLNAMIAAQVGASKQYADFITNVCLKDGKALMVGFEYDETQVDSEGVFKGIRTKNMRIPLLAAITHPNINVEEGSVDFELEITQSEEIKTKTSAEVSTSVSYSAFFSPVKATFAAKASHSKETTRKTDTRAKYSFHTSLKRSGPPEGMMRVIDFLTDAATKPVTIDVSKDSTNADDLKNSDFITATQADRDGTVPADLKAS